MAKKKTEQEKSPLTIVKDGVEENITLNKPTAEETAKFKEDFEKAAADFQVMKWEVSEKGKFGANDVALFLFDFMKRFAFWNQTGWMGMIKMDEELKKAQLEADDNTGLMLGYQALEFCAYMLTNPAGVGYDSALAFEQIADKYSKIAVVVGTKVEEARKLLKDIQYKQESWAAAEQGFFLAELEPTVDEKIQEKTEPKTEETV